MISLIIKIKKAHDCDNISVKMTQICGEPIVLPPKLMFETALKEKNISRYLGNSKCGFCS